MRPRKSRARPGSRKCRLLRKTIRPSGVRLAERFSLGPLALGSSLAALLLVVLLGMLALTGTLSRLVSGDVPEWLGQDFRVGVVLCLILALLAQLPCCTPCAWPNEA